jgi:uncharacterized protein YjbI with pentapeptide repeats
MSEDTFGEEVRQLISDIFNCPSNKLSVISQVANLDITEAYIGADLQGANLSNDDLSNFNFTDVNLSNADLRGCILTNVNFTNATLEGAIFDKGTTIGI